ncbi:MAG: hypothetical protein AABX75_03195 [Nanoarchaeota archaeon]
MTDKKKNCTAAFVWHTTMPLAHDEFPRIFLDHASSLKLVRLNDSAPWREDLGRMVANAKKYTLRNILFENNELHIRLDNVSSNDAQLPLRWIVESTTYRVPLREYAGLYAELLTKLQSAKPYAVVRIAVPDGLAGLLGNL